MDCSTPGLPVHHQLPECTQTHVHWVGDAIQPSHPLLSPFPPAFNPSHYQGLFKWVSSCGVAGTKNTSVHSLMESAWGRWTGKGTGKSKRERWTDSPVPAAPSWGNTWWKYRVWAKGQEACEECADGKVKTGNHLSAQRRGWNQHLCVV